MLKGISPLISPDLMHVLMRMGHGDEIVFTDAHFPAASCHPLVIRADGLMIPDLLRAVLPLFELDSYVSDPVTMMQAASGDDLDPAVEASYLAAIRDYHPSVPPVVLIERFAFYERARKAFAIVTTGETRKYGNIILKKGVTPVS